MSERAQSTEEVLSLLRTFVAEQQAVYSLVSLGIFGSFARGQAHSDSDVDIVFDTTAPNLFMTAMMKQDLEKLLGRPVDVLQLRGLTNERLKARIESEAIYV
jgi:predicted nucleotidyltransferase